MTVISIVGAGDGDVYTVSGLGAGDGDFWLGKGQVDGFYHAPVETEWSATRQQRGGSFKGLENPARDMTLGFHVVNDTVEAFEAAFSRLDGLFSYHLDPWDTNDELAKLVVKSDADVRWLRVQKFEQPEFAPDIDPTELQYGNVFYSLRAAQPFWESNTEVTFWETGSSSGSGTIKVSNPTDVPMFQRWVLTPGTWTVPDVFWQGRKRARTIKTARTITLKPNASTLVIDLDPMNVMMQDAAGTNVMGQVGGGYYFMNIIPPHTPVTELPISVTGASGGARAELHQPRLWSTPFGGW